MQVQHFFDEATWTLTYLVWDEASGDAVVIDPCRKNAAMAAAAARRCCWRGAAAGPCGGWC